jgi:hypothetical protein
MGTLYRGWALGTPDGVTLMREGIAAFRATGARTGQTHYLAVLARAYAHLGEAARARLVELRTTLGDGCLGAERDAADALLAAPSRPQRRH